MAFGRDPGTFRRNLGCARASEAQVPVRQVHSVCSQVRVKVRKISSEMNSEMAKFFHLPLSLFCSSFFFNFFEPESTSKAVTDPDYVHKVHGHTQSPNRSVFLEAVLQSGKTVPENMCNGHAMCVNRTSG